MKSKAATISIATICVSSALNAAAVAQELRDTLNDIDVGRRWSYNNWESAQAAAAKSKKPILALFR